MFPVAEPRLTPLYSRIISFFSLITPRITGPAETARSLEAEHGPSTNHCGTPRDGSEPGCSSVNRTRPYFLRSRVPRERKRSPSRLPSTELPPDYPSRDVDVGSFSTVTFCQRSSISSLAAALRNSGAATRSNIHPWLNSFGIFSFRFRRYIHQAASLIHGLIEVSAAVVVILPARRGRNTSCRKSGNDGPQRQRLPGGIGWLLSRLLRGRCRLRRRRCGWSRSCGWHVDNDWSWGRSRSCGWGRVC